MLKPHLPGSPKFNKTQSKDFFIRKANKSSNGQNIGELTLKTAESKVPIKVNNLKTLSGFYSSKNEFPKSKLE